MNTPTLPHVSLPNVSLSNVSLPHVNVPHVDVHDVTDRVSDRASEIGGFVSEAFSTGVDRVHDLAATAVDAIDDIPDKAIALAGALIPALRPTPKRSKRPFVMIGFAIASIVVVAWFLKQKRRATVEPYAVPAASSSDNSVSAAS